MTPDAVLLQRYLDGEMSPPEAAQFRERLQADPELQRELEELKLVGALLRGWAEKTGTRAARLVEPTLERVQDAQQGRARRSAALGYALVAAAVIVPWSQQGVIAYRPAAEPLPPPGAAIERLEAGDKQAQVFVVGEASTPVVWLADDSQEEDGSERGPG